MLKMFYDGGFFMYPILVLFIIGLAICLERLYTLTRSSVSTPKLIARIRKALEESGVDDAKKICAQTRGPVASVVMAGLLRIDEGIENVEKAISSAGSVEMAFLERGLIWLSTIISLAPMLGFTGTVQGMIEAFQAIEKANDISPAIVAHGIQVALLTTLFGLVVAMVIQFMHNYFVNQIDRLTINMEEGAVELVDTLVAIQKK
ncbi:MotA/TolQ/ExbB proton channel family protein [candidate division KSB1 bacterium]|nr:MotA/TolQ/ExbB proton channel family protein [candidate division KSB1 bacterium]